MSERIKEEQIVYSAQEAAKILHSSPNYIYELVKKGKLKAVKLKSIKILKSTLESFLKENEIYIKILTTYKKHAIILIIE